MTNWLMELWGLIKEPLMDFADFILLAAKYFVWLLTYPIVAFLNRVRVNRRISGSLRPSISPQKYRELTRYYVPTGCQDSSPNDALEPIRSIRPRRSDNCIRYFLRVLDKEKEKFIFLVLADSGMGKTTFLVNLYAQYMGKRARRYGMKYVRFINFDRENGIDVYLNGIKDDEKQETVLLLDGLDEDILAIESPRDRVNHILRLVAGFACVIIVCRTQFFRDESEIPSCLPIVDIHGDAIGIETLYISPFEEEEIQLYLRKRFLYRFAFREYIKARQFVENTKHFLFARPMVLSFIEDIIKQDKAIKLRSEAYEAVIQGWLAREAKLRAVANKRKVYSEELYEFSKRVSKYIYGIYLEKGQFSIGSFIELDRISKNLGHLSINVFDMQAHSLLTRDVDNTFKFSHKSFLEYFWAINVLEDKGFANGFSFRGQSDAIEFYVEMSINKYLIPLLWKRFGLKDGEQYASGKQYELHEAWGVEANFFIPVGAKHQAVLSVFDLSELLKSERLCLKGKVIEDLRFMGAFTRLKFLDISDTGIDNLSWVFPCAIHSQLSSIVVGSDFPKGEIERFVERYPQVKVGLKEGSSMNRR